MSVLFDKVIRAEAAVEAVREQHPYALKAIYIPDRDVFEITLSNARTVTFSARHIGSDSAAISYFSRDDLIKCLENIEISPTGQIIQWPNLDEDLFVPDLLLGNDPMLSAPLRVYIDQWETNAHDQAAKKAEGEEASDPA